MRNAYITKSLLTLALFAAALSPAKAALLDGNTVQVDYLFPNVSASVGSGQALVGSGLEFSNFMGLADINVADNGLTISFQTSTLLDSTPFNGIRLTDINLAIGSFTSVNVNALSNLSGFGSSNVTFDADNIFINLSGLTPMQTNQIVLDINAPALNPTAVDVPEPATLFGVASALGLVVVARRRR
jgi:hypothetical protein